jgi:hypothetical protein
MSCENVCSICGFDFEDDASALTRYDTDDKSVGTERLCTYCRQTLLSWWLKLDPSAAPIPEGIKPIQYDLGRMFCLGLNAVERRLREFAQLGKPDELLRQVTEEGDYFLHGDSAWIQVGNLVVWIRNAHDRVVVEICKSKDVERTIDSCQAMFEDGDA